MSWRPWALSAAPAKPGGGFFPPGLKGKGLSGDYAGHRPAKGAEPPRARHAHGRHLPGPSLFAPGIPGANPASPREVVDRRLRQRRHGCGPGRQTAGGPGSADDLPGVPHELFASPWRPKGPRRKSSTSFTSGPPKWCRPRVAGCRGLNSWPAPTSSPAAPLRAPGGGTAEGF